jgi:2-polyprenyl-6-methoxyphenol hydroxylase-like FAD-dependent oxidoreductase
VAAAAEARQVSRPRDSCREGPRAGPSGLAAALELDRAGFNVVVVDSCRDSNKRLNVITTRAEVNRRLHELGALKHLRSSGTHKAVSSREIWDELKQAYTEMQPPVFFDAPGYVRPGVITDQISTHCLQIADLETALLCAAKEQAQRSATGEIKVVVNATVELTRGENTKRNHVTLVPQDGAQPHVDLGTPDLIVWASGKADPGLERDLGIKQLRNIDILSPGLESLAAQAFLLFILRPRVHPPPRVFVRTVLTLERWDAQPQKLIRAFGSKGTDLTCTLQLPLGLTPVTKEVPYNAAEVESFVLKELNAEFKTSYPTMADLQADYKVIYGSMRKLFWVEASIPDALTHGGNTILVGDAGGTSTPGAAMGAATGVAIDLENVARLGGTLLERHRGKAAAVGASEGARKRSGLIAQYAREKREAIVVWARAGRAYFVTQREANEIRGVGDAAADRNEGPTEGKQHAPSSFHSVQVERQSITLFCRKGLGASN